MSTSGSRDLVGHWPLTADLRDQGPNGLHGRPLGELRVTSEGTRFHGGSLRVRSSPVLAVDDELTVSAWVRLPERRATVAGDLVTRFDPRRREGFGLTFADGSALGSQSNTRHLVFGADWGTQPAWEPVGRPGSALHVGSLAVYDGHLYAGTFEDGEDDTGRVYRLDGVAWTDTGAPVSANAVSALAVHDGALYAGTSHARAGGSGLPDERNTTPGGEVLRLDATGTWSSTGRAGDSDGIGALVSFDGSLFAMSSYRQGVHRLVEGQRWVSAGTPGRRLLALGVHRGVLYGLGNDHANVEDAIAQTRAGIVVAARSSRGGGGVFRWHGGTVWRSLGLQPETTQVYSMAVHDGAIHIGTWPTGLVFRRVGERWVRRGRLGGETEVMGMLTYNGMLYAGTVPHAEVHRFDDGGSWTRVGTLDETPDALYRRASSMAVFDGRLFVGTLPSGMVWAMDTGQCVSLASEFPGGWHHVAAIRSSASVSLLLDGDLVATRAGYAAPSHIAPDVDLLIGGGRQDGFDGWLRDVMVHRRALAPQEIRRLARVPGHASRAT